MNQGILWVIGIGWMATTAGATCLGLYGKEFAAAAMIAGGVFMVGIILGRAWDHPCRPRDCDEEETEEG